MTLQEFFDRVKTGDPIPPLQREARTSGQGTLHSIFDVHLEAEADKAQDKAAELGVDTLHTTNLFWGVTTLHFISDMITDWLPDPKGWVQGGRLSAKFTGPIKTNEVLTCRGRVRDKLVKDNRKYVVCDVWVENSAGEKVVVGEAVIAAN